MSEHDLKTWPGPFAAIRNGIKRHEIRKFDRDYKTGDVLLLREWVPNDAIGFYTGETLRVLVTYITRPNEWGLPSDLCVMSIEPTK